MIKLDSKIPEGPIADKWTNHKFNMKLVNPANKRKFDIIVVGTGLAGASAQVLEHLFVVAKQRIINLDGLHLMLTRHCYAHHSGARFSGH